MCRPRKGQAYNRSGNLPSFLISLSTCGSWIPVSPLLGFVNLVFLIGLCIFDEAMFTAAPLHLNTKDIGQRPRCKDSQRFITGKVSAAADHFLALLRHRATVNPDFG